jgi:hypothetical protein
MSAKQTYTIKVISKRQLKARAEAESKSMLGVSSRTAFKWLDAGKLRGTMAEAEFKGLRFLLETAE